MKYNADIRYVARGLFVAELRDSSIATKSTENPEYDLCHEMLKAGCEDGAIQFWRGTTPSLSFPSVHRAAKYRVSTGEKTYLQLVRRATPESLQKFRESLAKKSSL